jgi:hypothetical protein
MKDSGDLACEQKAETAEQGRCCHGDPEGGIQVFSIDLTSLDDSDSKSLRHQHLNKCDVDSRNSHQPECAWAQQSRQTGVNGKAK